MTGSRSIPEGALFVLNLSRGSSFPSPRLRYTSFTAPRNRLAMSHYLENIGVKSIGPHEDA